MYMLMRDAGGEGKASKVYMYSMDGIKDTPHVQSGPGGLTPSAIACPIPNLGTFLAQRGLKCSVRQILPPLDRVSTMISEKNKLHTEVAPCRVRDGRRERERERGGT